LSASLGRLLADAPADTAVVASLHAAALRVVRVAADKERKGGADSSSSSSSAAAAFALEPSVVAESSLRSLNYQSGILLLEEMLLVRRGDLSIAQAMATLQRARAAAHQAAHGPASAKAASTSSSRRGASSEAAAAEAEGEGGGRGYDGANSDGWLQLSRLYAALGEKDVLVGLSLRAAQHEGTHEALRLELAGQHASAITCYNKLLTRQELLLRKQKGGGGGGSGDEQEMQADEARVHGLERVRGGLGTA
jgi:hypothetical protein